MLKVWGRNTSSNVQKVMWAIGEMQLPHERIDVGGAFGKTKDAFYLAMNPNSLVPTLEEDDGFTLWELNSIVRYLAAKHNNRTLEPADLRTRALAHKWMDWQLSVMGPSLTPVFWGLIRTPPEEARRQCDRHRQGQVRRGRHDHGRAARQDRIPRRRRVFLWRHSGRGHDLPLYAAYSRAAVDAEPRSLVRGYFGAPGVQGAGRFGAVDVNRIRARRPSHPSPGG